MPLDQLWATWRSSYVTGDDASRRELRDVEPDESRSLFERILDSGAPDDETFIVLRAEHCFVILNRFPYTSGHLMVLPNRAVAELEQGVFGRMGPSVFEKESLGFVVRQPL